VRWYEIQQLFCHVKFDVLLLLDCGYADLAGQRRDDIPPGPVELLAATEGALTPAPGPRSFTAAMIKVMKEHLEKEKQITISKLHAGLCHRKPNLYALPFHLHLRENQSYRSILLERLEEPKEQRASSSSWGSEMDLPIGMDHISTEPRVDAWVENLHRETTKGDISGIHVNDIIRTTGDIGKFVSETMYIRLATLGLRFKIW
jgi:hypothetical protein